MIHQYVQCFIQKHMHFIESFARPVSAWLATFRGKNDNQIDKSHEAKTIDIVDISSDFNSVTLLHWLHFVSFMKVNPCQSHRPFRSFPRSQLYAASHTCSKHSMGSLGFFYMIFLISSMYVPWQWTCRSIVAHPSFKSFVHVSPLNDNQGTFLANPIAPSTPATMPAGTPWSTTQAQTQGNHEVMMYYTVDFTT